MIGIVIATEMEAAPLLTFQVWERLAEAPFSIYQTTIKAKNIRAVLIISGMGKVAAAVATHLLIFRYKIKRIFNIGICGSLKEPAAFDIGTIFRIDYAIEGDRWRKDGPGCPENCASDFFSALPGARLVTCDEPVFGGERKKKLSSLGELADMEGAAVARVANMYSCPCILLKGISDNANEGGRKILAQNIEAVSHKLAMLFLKTISVQ